MDVMNPKPFILTLVSAVAFSAILAGKPQENGFPLSVWKERKQVTQIPWWPLIGQGNLRADFRQQFSAGVTIRPDDVRKLGDKPDLILFARVLEGGQAITPIYSVMPRQPTGDAAVLKEWVVQPIHFSMQAIVRPGKYKLELALLDRSKGRYSTRDDDVTIEGNPNDPVERAFQPFSKFEFVPEIIFDLPEQFANVPLPERTSMALGGTDLRDVLRKRPPVLTSARAFTTDKPSFVIDRPGTTHVSVITILDPPEAGLRDAKLLDLFQINLSSLLAVFARLDTPRGTARLIGVDLSERTRPLDGIELKGVTRELLDSTIKKDTSTVSVATLANEGSRGRFFHDVLRARLQEAERDVSEARHVIIVVSASSTFPDTSSLAIPSTRDCHCQVYYMRFALVMPGEPDNIDDMLKAYKPQVFEPLTWREFREDFGKIYAQLLK